jgi:hypothetical protein
VRASNGVEAAHGEAAQPINGAFPISSSNTAGVKGSLRSLGHEAEKRGYIEYVCRSLQGRHEPHPASSLP